METNRKTILLVDDDMTNLAVGKKALSGSYNVLTLNSGMLLLEMLERMKPDLVLLDVNMPEMDGYETLRRLRASMTTAIVPVIFLTARSDKQGVIEGITSGAVDYIIKPFSPPELLARIDAHFNPVATVEAIDDKAASSPPPDEPEPGPEPADKRELFHEGHGDYTLVLDNTSSLLHQAQVACPACAHKFDNLAVTTSLLKPVGTDEDSRTRYDGIEPMHYEVVTCPECFFSAPIDKFGDIGKRAAKEARETIAPYVYGLRINSGAQRDTHSVFAGYYLALLCAPGLENHQLITAGLWRSLGRLYQDCGDEFMHIVAAQRAMDDYTYAFKNLSLSDKTSQSLACALGEMHQRAGDLERAREYYFIAKSERNGTPAITRKATILLDDVRELLKAQTDK